MQADEGGACRAEGGGGGEARAAHGDCRSKSGATVPYGRPTANRRSTPLREPWQAEARASPPSVGVVAPETLAKECCACKSACGARRALRGSEWQVVVSVSGRVGGDVQGYVRVERASDGTVQSTTSTSNHLHVIGL